MTSPLEMEDAFSRLANYTMYSPYITIFTICALYLVFMRVWTGYLNSQIQNDATSSEKEIPIMPYWLPYLGHAPAMGLDFDGLLAKARWGPNRFTLTEY